MDFSVYVINAISAVIAVEYIDYGFPKKYSGFRRWGIFAAGCVVYFLAVTALNRIIDFEGVLGFFYGAVLIAYGMYALKGRTQDFVVAGLLWVLIAIIGTYGIFSVMGILTENSLGEMLQLRGERRIYASVVAIVVKFSMGKIAAVFFRRRDGIYKEENRIVASAFVFMTLLAMGLFWLEAGNPESSVRYALTIGILLDEVGIIVFLVQLYQRLGRYQKEKMEAQYQREREQERLEGLMDMLCAGTLPAGKVQGIMPVATDSFHKKVEFITFLIFFHVLYLHYRTFKIKKRDQTQFFYAWSQIFLYAVALN